MAIGRRAAFWLVVLTVAVASTVVVVVSRRADPPAPILRAGLLEVSYRTPDQVAQAAVARRCGLQDGFRMTPAHVRYSVPPSAQAARAECARGSPEVVAVGIPG